MPSSRPGIGNCTDELLIVEGVGFRQRSEKWLRKLVCVFIWIESR